MLDGEIMAGKPLINETSANHALKAETQISMIF
jgi:hypothetical protein